MPTACIPQGQRVNKSPITDGGTISRREGSSSESEYLELVFVYSASERVRPIHPTCLFIHIGRVIRLTKRYFSLISSLVGLSRAAVEGIVWTAFG